MHELAEQALAPVRERAAQANAPLFERLGITPRQLERLVSPLVYCENRSLGNAAAKAALRGATRF